MTFAKEVKIEIIKRLKEETGVSLDLNLIATPPKPEMGDLAVPMFQLAKEMSKNPVELAKELATKMTGGSFEKVLPLGPYLNFYINAKLLAEKGLAEVLTSKKFGVNEAGKGQKVMVEYFSPNTNKPMTVGHLRNVTLGATVSRLLKAGGYKVMQACLFNDRGIAVAKSMVAYDLFGKGDTPAKKEMKSDQFVGHYYVMFGQKAEADPSLEDKAKASLIKWEAGDRKTLALWKKMNGWVYKGYNQTFKKLHEGDFDKVFYESKIYDKGRDIILKNLGKGVIKKGSEGEVFADLEGMGMPNKILLRSDGTALYITQDLFLTLEKDKFGIDKSIIVIADEQNLQMQQTFAILESLGQSKEKNFHLSYGMMRLPEGKIKSREGFGKALADELIENLETLALKEVESRNPDFSAAKKKKIANQIMNAALKFYILNVDPVKTMIFNPEEAVSFAGKTGPYLQYTAVRLNSILKESKVPAKPHAHLLREEIEKQVLNKLKDYPEVIEAATKQYSPSILTHYLFELAQLANTFYHDLPILKSEPNLKGARLALIKAIVKVLENGLEICGIEVPEKM